MVSVCSEGGLNAPAAFFARILNSYLQPSCRSVTVYAGSTTFTLLAFTQILEGRSRLSTMYPVSLWPPSNCGSVHWRVTVLLVMLTTSGLPGASIHEKLNISGICLCMYNVYVSLHFISLLVIPNFSCLPIGSRATCGSVGALGLPMPAKLIAITLNSYSRPSVSPVTLCSFILRGAGLALFHNMLFLSLNSTW